MTLNPPRHLFRPAQRLLTKQQFNDVFAQAQIRAAVPEVLVLASERLSTETSQGPRIGFIVPKKKIRHAVGRNHFKRVFR
jgi:ribonuclease P protein component